MTDIEQIMEQIIEDFSMFDDWNDRYAYIVDLGRKLPSLEDRDKTDGNKVQGCTSNVWLLCNVKDGKYYFHADSDAHIVKGLVAILLKIYSDRSKDEINNIDIHNLFNKLGLEQHLSPSRSNGFFAIVKKIKEFTNQ